MSCSGTPSIFTGNNTIKNGVVTNSKVVNLPTPINPGDAATKFYVDTHSGGVSSSNLITFSFTLINTTSIQLFSDTIGIFDFYISNNINGPMSKFLACKTNPAKIGSLNRIISVPGNGSISNCYLEITWNVNTGITIKKTTGEFDGTYLCSFTSIPLSL